MLKSWRTFVSISTFEKALGLKIKFQKFSFSGINIDIVLTTQLGELVGMPIHSSPDILFGYPVGRQAQNSGFLGPNCWKYWKEIWIVEILTHL